MYIFAIVPPTLCASQAIIIGYFYFDNNNFVLSSNIYIQIFIVKKVWLLHAECRPSFSKVAKLSLGAKRCAMF